MNGLKVVMWRRGGSTESVQLWALGGHPEAFCENCGYLDTSRASRLRCLNCNFDHGHWEAVGMPLNWQVVPC